LPVKNSFLVLIHDYSVSDMNQPDIILTSDGSHTLSVREIHETYHSVHGAISESKHVYLNKGYKFLQDLPEIRVLEIGFGTGLNCLLTALEADRVQVMTYYYALEKFPLSDKIISILNYPDLTGEKGKALFGKIHASPWNSEVWISSHFELKKIEADALTLDWTTFPGIDLVYFDAFGPDKQPEIWNPHLFRMIFQKMRANAVFVTYCAKGSVRRELERTGLKMERLPGPAGKREMLRGIKVL
jgi:tRNA U34 5-methylaminomethyl-2-thiouridine-forming methyltransferase MnmC